MINVDQKSPRISVVVTTHSRPAQLSIALKSIINQTFQNFEIVLVSDEGSQETKLIAANFLREYDRLFVLPEINGPSEARTFGMHNATGDWICFLDDDDFFEKSFLENVEQNLDDYNALYYTNYKNFYGRNHELGLKVEEEHIVDNSNKKIKELYVENFIPIHSFFISGAIAKQVTFDTELDSLEDWDFLLKVHHKFKLNFTHLDVSGPVICRDSDQLTRGMTDAGTKALNYLSIYRKRRSPEESISVKRSTHLSLLGLDIPPELI